MKKYKLKPYDVPAWIMPAIEVLKPRERLTVSKWAEKNRVLDEASAMPGPWRNNVTPYLVGVMDAFSDSQVERIIFIKST
ncbi:MAG: phage terminase large subunit family protein, partial [Oscillibacter sp.]